MKNKRLTCLVGYLALLITLINAVPNQVCAEMRRVKFVIGDGAYKVACDSHGVPHEIQQDSNLILKDAASAMAAIVQRTAALDGVIPVEDEMSLELIWVAQEKCISALRISTSKVNMRLSPKARASCPELSGNKPVNTLDLMEAIGMFQSNSLPDFNHDGKKDRRDLVAYKRLAHKSMGLAITCSSRSSAPQQQSQPPPRPTPVNTPTSGGSSNWPMVNPFR